MMVIDTTQHDIQEQTSIPYANYRVASSALAEIQAIDFYFALNVCQTLNTSNSDIFHLAIACHQALQNGHSCLPIDLVAGKRLWQSGEDYSDEEKPGFSFSDKTTLLAELNKYEALNTHNAMMVLDNEHLYLRRYYLFERQLEKAIKVKLSETSQTNVEATAAVVTELFPHDEHQGIDWQKVAVANALNKNFTVIAGGPGTGKTYTVTKLLAALVMLNHHQDDARLNIALTAPTGKAAQRLSESILAAIAGFKGMIDDDVLEQLPSKAQTIHRLLGVRANQVNFKHDQNNLLPVDVLLIDEASMIDLALMTRIFRALPEHAKVILLGDPDQLPSVASGSVLSDIAPRPHRGYSEKNSVFLSKVLHHDIGQLLAVDQNNVTDHLTILQHSRRFDGQGGIGVVAKHVIAGNATASWQRLEADASRQVSLESGENMTVLSKYIDTYYKPLLAMTDLSQAFAQLAKFRVLVAMRKGELGVENLNHIVVQRFIEQQLIDTNQGYKKMPLYHGMPIMITENHHKLGLYNGDIGLIWQENDQLVAVFEQVDGYKTLIPSRLPSFELVYAMTIHKTQGSEFNHVLMALPDNSQNKLLTRELLYTGITRAKQQLSVIGEYAVWKQGVEAQVIRHSQLNL